jgi:hypothetical protein
MSQFFVTPFDPYAPGAYAIQDVFAEEFMRPDHANFALFVGEEEDTDKHMLLLVAPALNHVPATAVSAKWRQAHELPVATWRLLVGSGDPWERFGVPSPRRGAP